ncbi:MAG: 50S ribosomal protein L30 [archaeon]|nr:50S ribosomal protein L30 [archaeon]
MGILAAIRVRGSVDVKKEFRDTLKILRLDRVNHLVLVEEKQRTMLKKVQPFITFGEIKEETLERLLQKRGRLAGDKRLDEKFLKKHNSFKEVAKEIISGKKKLKDFAIKPVFRLHPPKKGYERDGIKKSFHVGGALGYRADDINKLIERMI